MNATSDLVDRWVEGCCDSRGIARERVGRGWRIEVADTSRLREYFIASPSLGELHALMTPTLSPDVWLTVVGEPDADIRSALAGLDAVTHDEIMMIAAVVQMEMPPEVRIERKGQVAYAQIALAGEIAAKGQAAVRGTDVIFDRIETMPRFRRRGLGSLIMTGLTSWAADQQAETGLLMASAEGRQLYGSLGWRQVTPIATFRGRPTQPSAELG